ncbi:MAG: hypothetical protein GY820_30765 [Gammaproteobacteria bacterium]|nr:hypothetical protein [Gammaproteobacteria bacterium]
MARCFLPDVKYIGTTSLKGPFAHRQDVGQTSANRRQAMESQRYADIIIYIPTMSRRLPALYPLMSQRLPDLITTYSAHPI